MRLLTEKIETTAEMKDDEESFLIEELRKNLLKRVIIVDEISPKYHDGGRIVDCFVHSNGKADHTVLFSDMSIGYFDAKREGLILVN
jgi:hypothetical protein